MIKALVNFDNKIRKWDGFGVNYVETCQTPDYEKMPQDYGGFSILSEDGRQSILDMIFGEDGLKPGVVKMFCDPFHQEKSNQNGPDPDDIDLSNYDHTTTTKWMRYFVREGLARTRARGGELQIITTLYGPPGWMTRQKFLRGRDLDPDLKYECAKYMISWAKFLKEQEKFPIKYISLHNEGEDYHRWPEDGSTSNLGGGHDYNMYWPPEQVVEFLKMMRVILNAQGLEDVGLTPGETSNWHRFSDWGYAEAIANDPEAVKNLGLITSHGFYSGAFGTWFGDHRSLGTDIIREKRPELHSWVTSTSWSKMDANFVYEMRGNIYSAKNNAIIPWACIQWSDKWVGGDPNPGTAFRISSDGTFTVEPGYYYYKQICRAGQPGMAVAQANSTHSEVAITAFAGDGTENPDAFVVTHIGNDEKKAKIQIAGVNSKVFEGFRTSQEERYYSIGEIAVRDGLIEYTLPPRSVTTFYAKREKGEGK